LSTDILISSDPWENRVAILEEGTLSEIYVEREEKVIGSIFKGKVQNVLPGMGASFVDIGLGRNAFLYVDDINKTPLNIGDVEITSGRSGWTINEKVNRGDDVLVQIVEEPRGLKGARISTNISLPGRYLILMPTGKYSGVSRKIESAEERNRLKGIMKAIRPEGMATVVRTAANRVSSAELVADLGVLIRMWHGILEQFKRAPSPALLHKDMNIVYKAARDFGGRFDVGSNDRIFEVFTAGEFAGIDVDYRQRFGRFDNDRATGRQFDRWTHQAREFLVDLIIAEQRATTGVGLNAVEVLRTEQTHEITYVFGLGRIVDVDVLDFGRDEIARGFVDNVHVLVQQRG